MIMCLCVPQGCVSVSSPQTLSVREAEERKRSGEQEETWVVLHTSKVVHTLPRLCFLPHGLIERSPAGKPRGRQPKQPRHCTDVAGVINISDDSSTESDAMDSDSNSSPDSVQDNSDDVIFVDQTSYQMGMLNVYFIAQLILSPFILIFFFF